MLRQSAESLTSCLGGKCLVYYLSYWYCPFDQQNSGNRVGRGEKGAPDSHWNGRAGETAGKRTCLAGFGTSDY